MMASPSVLRCDQKCSEPCESRSLEVEDRFLIAQTVSKLLLQCIEGARQGTRKVGNGQPLAGRELKWTKL